MKLLALAILLTGCASPMESAYMRSSGIDNDVYSFAKEACPNCNCVERAKISKMIHETFPEYKADIHRATDFKGRFHDFVKVYWNGEHLRDSMQAEGFQDVGGYPK